jgi:hypothetical protein
MQYVRLSRKNLSVFVLLILMCAMSPAWAGSTDRVSKNALANMPVKEVTVFKDGHAFVLHEGPMPTDAEGNVVLDYLPTPIVGTFWSYSAQTDVRLTGVVSGKRIVMLDKTALTIPELIRANVGARVRVAEAGLGAYECVIFGIPTRSSQELCRNSPPSSPPELSQPGNIVLLKYEGGIKAVPIDRISEITFLEEPKATLGHEEFRNIMTLKLDWGRKETAKTANVGMVYVQRGIRWIPNYRIDIDGKGQAVIKLQATVINELTDIENVKAHLVIGVPKFTFEDTPDPISLQHTIAQLSNHFQRDSRNAYAFSNSNMIMSQAAMPVRHVESPRERDTMDLGPDITESAKNEDLFVFTLENVTLKKGQRMVVPVAEYKLKYRDVFVLDLPFGPPPELRRRFNSEQTARLARLYHAPKVMHKIRLDNDADCPLTTAPALILRQDRLIGQSMTTYTAVGASCDVELTVAVDISVEKLDVETERINDAARWDGCTYARSNLTGTITLTNHRANSVNLEVCRSVLGNIDSADHDGKIEQLGRHEGGWMATDSYPFWWGWYDWPYWWYRFNSIGRVDWELKLEPEQKIELEYKYHYFWRT